MWYYKDMIDNKTNEVDMTKETIDYVGISGSQGSSFGFYFSTLENKKLVYTKTYLLKDLVNDLRTKYTLPDSYMASSSMDFASENGFATDDGAIKLWNDAIDDYDKEVNAVGVKPENINYGSAI